MGTKSPPPSLSLWFYFIRKMLTVVLDIECLESGTADEAVGIFIYFTSTLDFKSCKLFSEV